MARIRANNQYVFSLKTATGSLIDFGADVTKISVTDGDGPITSGDKATGIAPKVLNVTAVMDTAPTGATSLWEYAHANAGATLVAYAVTLAPGAASQANPKYAGTLTMPARPGFDTGDINDSVLTFELAFNTDSYAKAIA
jgi:hypothetical protein